MAFTGSVFVQEMTYSRASGEGEAASVKAAAAIAARHGPTLLAKPLPVPLSSAAAPVKAQQNAKLTKALATRSQAPDRPNQGRPSPVQNKRSQDRPSQKRKQSPNMVLWQQQQHQQQKLKQAKTVYHEFSTSTETTSDSDYTTPSADVVDEINSPTKPLPWTVKANASKQPQSQLQAMTQLPELTAVAVGTSQMPGTNQGLKEAKGVTRAGVRTPASQAATCEALGPGPKAYTRARKGQTPTLVAPAGPQSSGLAEGTKGEGKGMGKSHMQAPRASLPAGQPSQVKATTDNNKPAQYKLPQGAKTAKPAKTGNFADLLEAVLIQPDTMLGHEAQHHSSPLKLGLAPSIRGPSSAALGDITNAPAKKGGVKPGQAPAGRTAAVVVNSQKAETKTFSRRSARVQGRQEVSQPDNGHQSHQQKASSSMDLFATNHQVSHLTHNTH